MFHEAEIQCPFCFQRQTAFVDPEDRRESVQVIDCTVCCRPMDLRVFRDSESGEITVDVSRSGGM
ncbi:CPXCG motif-containing cysteine-rich protein [bacterium]|nr:CPXCG motif-containing cysteine-rich protein [bacterium]